MKLTRIAIGAGATALFAATGALATTLVQQRRMRGMETLAQTLPVHSKWWREHAKREGELLYVVLGDSAAQGIGASKPNRGYVGAIMNELAETTGRSIRVVNLSIAGARLREALELQLPAMRRLGPPDFVTVGIGANDIGSYDRERFEREIEELYSAMPPHTIVGDIPSFYIGAGERRVREANAILHETARRHGLVVAPVYSETRRLGVLRYALNQVAADFFHPNDRGYKAWARAFLPLVREVARGLRVRPVETSGAEASGSGAPGPGAPAQ
ncbi:SGNH/GDSL hydrolase family protein [Salinibacterium sp. dk2585]|uniref:SGNH/GDSL hydrolase family protein n=1 Tax=unclassified Salinibacterium TaxID=2632331 RepID=UPI0011C24D91|nr:MULTISPECIES: SGNH/GDSL hydrolase family protein [unclassified Salinibacterium]QEE60562.1 SGNH/GDSL hydrolase family protein [Salinibacterium sp. dk2585]TXK55634.1 SGNH/GDSL hydrolase family protein [Salinibacterium sp. dk5596]